jgi:hypothetical protein
MSRPGYVLRSSDLDTRIPGELVSVVAHELDLWGVDLGPQGWDAVARALLQAEAWRLRELAREAEHVGRRDSALRRAEIAQRVYTHMWICRGRQS